MARHIPTVTWSLRAPEYGKRLNQCLDDMSAKGKYGRG